MYVYECVNVNYIYICICMSKFSLRTIKKGVQGELQGNQNMDKLLLVSCWNSSFLAMDVDNVAGFRGSLLRHTLAKKM